MSRSDTTLYEFGAFRLDVAERVLWRGEELLVLPSKVFDTLRMLVEKEGRVVSKSELMEAIWADAFVEESNLSQNIYLQPDDFVYLPSTVSLLRFLYGSTR